MIPAAYNDLWFWITISILASWRITTMICYEAGPFDLVSRLRMFLYKSRLGGLIDCFHCCAVWIAAIMTLSIFGLIREALFIIPAVAGGASIIERRLTVLFHQNQSHHEEIE